MEDDDGVIYKVVVNDEEQYSIVPADRGENPAGWRDTGTQGAKQQCSQYVEQVWTDMRPLSLRRRMDALKEA